MVTSDVGKLSANCYRSRHPSSSVIINKSFLYLNARPELPFSSLKSLKFNVDGITSDSRTPQMMSQCQVSLTIFDENIFPPVFDDDDNDYVMGVPKEAGAGYVIIIIKARDNDTKNSGITYSILEDLGSVFVSINSSGHLTLKKRLSVNLTLTVLARDSGLKSKSSRAKVFLFPVNPSEYEPRFDEFRYEINVDDKTPVGSIVSKLIASDSNRPGIINCYNYHLVPELISEESSINRDFGWFTINVNSGEIITNRPFNDSDIASDTTAFKYKARAHHCHVPFRECKADVIIVVVRSPSYGINCYGEPTTPSIPQDAYVGRHVVSLRTSEGFLRTKQLANIRLISSDESKYFELLDEGYEIVLKTRPTADTMNTVFNVTTQVISTNKPDLNSYCWIQIAFTEPDDLKIAFDNTQYVFQINDSHEIHSRVGTVTAELTSTDNLKAYTHVSNNFTYKILPGVESTSSIFTIDSNSGEIFLKDPSTIATSSSITFMVSSIYIKDIDRRVLVDTCRVKVQIRSSKVRLIFIPSGYYSMSINESTPVGTQIIKVKVRISGVDDDDDAERYQQMLHYSIPNNTKDILPFEVDSNTGWIKVKSDLIIDKSDINPILVYNFTVLVVYEGNTGDPTSSSATVVVIVTSQYANRSHFACLKDLPCLNNGTCQRDTNLQTPTISYSCKCPFNLRGSDCSVVGRAFEALKSQVLYQRIPFVINRKLSFGVELATLRSDSLLLYYSTGNYSYVTLEIIAKRPRLRLGGLSGGKPVVGVVEGTMVVADGSWWSIQVESIDDKIIMTSSICPPGKQTCDRCTDVSKCYSFAFIDQNLTFETTNQKLYVGGVGDINILLTNPGRASTHTFEGCLRYLILGGFDVFQGAVPSHPFSSPLKLCGANFASAFGMERKIHCSSNPCGNSGVCEETIDSVGYKCYCSGGYSGRNCSEETQSINIHPSSSLEYFQSEEYKRNELIRLSWDGSNERKKIKRSSSSSPMRSISINIKTDKSRQLLFKTKLEAKTYKHFLYILAGHMIYDVTDTSSSSSSSSSLFSLSNDLVEVSDNVWHRVLLQIYDDKVKLTVDGLTVEQTSSSSPPSSLSSSSSSSSPSSSLSPSTKLTDPLDLDIISFTLGSMEETIVHGETLQGFSGCLSNFTIDDELQPTSGSNFRFHVVYTTNGSNDYDDQSPPPCLDTAIGSQTNSWKISVIATASVIGILLTPSVIVVVVMLRRRRKRLSHSKKEDGIEMNSNNVNHHLPNNVGRTVLNSNRPDIVVTGRRRKRRSSWSDDDSTKDSSIPPVSKTSTPLTTLSEIVDSKTPPISRPSISNNPRIQNNPNVTAPSKLKFSMMAALPKSAIGVEASSVASNAFDRRILDDESMADDEKTISPSHSSVHRIGLDKPGFRIAQGTKVGPVWATQNIEKPPMMMMAHRQHFHHQIEPAPRSRSTELRHVISPTVGLTLEEIKRCSNRPTSVDLFSKRTPPTKSNRLCDFEPMPSPRVERNRYFNTGRKNHGRRIDDSDDDDDDFDDKTDAFTCSEFDIRPHLKMAAERLELKPPLPRPNSVVKRKRILNPADEALKRNFNLRSQSTTNEKFHHKPSDMNHHDIRSASTVEMMSRRQPPTPTASGLIGPDLLDWNLDLSWNSWLPLVAPVFHEISLLPSTALPDHDGSALSLRNHISSSSCLSIELDSKRQNLSRSRLGRRDSNPDYNLKGMPAYNTLHRMSNHTDDFEYGKVSSGRKSGTIACRLNEIEEERV